MDTVKKINKKLIVAVIAVCIVLLGAGGFVGYKFYKHEKSQNEQIQKLSGEITLLKSELESKNISWNNDGYNYLAIGNSITRHGYADYWWDADRGMAASTDEKDYVHLVTDYLETTHSNVTMNSVGFSAWETNYYDREEFYTIIDPYLSKEVDCVTIQLGENASNLDTWEIDFENLINYVKDKCPNADIYVVGDFWSNGNRDSLKEQAAKACDVIYVSLDGIKDNSEYYAGIGTEVEGDESTDLHTIEHEGVAKHPGDKGMEAIANRIIESMKNAD